MRQKRKRLDKEQSHIVIVGSGLAGLSAAISLEQAGFLNISILERDESFESQKEGYGLTLTYNPKGPLASLGVLEQVAQQDSPSRSHYLFGVGFGACVMSRVD
jgi:2-polyprenyl-6-methoxyphenol hydroxylase-like FAD-dependent oxidoreductase